MAMTSGGPGNLGVMCGIVAVLRRPSSRLAPDPQSVVRALSAAVVELSRAAAALVPRGPAALDGLVAVTEGLEEIDAVLRGVPGLECLLGPGAGPDGVRPMELVADLAEQAARQVEAMESVIDGALVPLEPVEAEEVNAVLLRLKDVTWALGRDRVGAARAVADLTGPGGRGAAPLSSTRLAGLWSIQVALGSLDRLEVRGRDSAGLHVLVHDHGLDLADPAVASLLAPRLDNALFTSQAV